MAEIKTLHAEPRTEFGTRASKKLRAAGRLPAMLESDGDSPHTDIHIEEREFHAARRAHAHLFDVELGGESESAVVQKIQWDALHGVMLHVEFRRVKRGVVAEFEVPLMIFGQPKGGVPTLMMERVKVRTIPSKIPDSIEVKVAENEEGTVITAGELELPEGVEWGIPLDTDLVSISSLAVEPEEGEDEEGEGEVEIIGEKKDEPDGDGDKS